MVICQKWGLTDIKWKDSNWTWSECRLVEELEGIYKTGIEASKLYEEDLWKKEPEKRKRLIRLICKIKNEEYDESKEISENVKIKIEDIKLVIKTISGIELNVKE